ncbi:hypothetical protein GOZ90_04745 [Agrobacterium vitis]|uniref:Uncharacterized protein n=1 Tax=Agrobacterium vitis TaxID=373 RepID=A0A6L6V873_AGRVI|nr:hypothetical protein [Agrobacterium vitis]MUZ71986.1 hypothetical protein [Agrobacterium vitis]
MKSWSIFKHALMLTAKNWRVALRILAPFIVANLILRALMFLYAVYGLNGEGSSSLWAMIPITNLLFNLIAFLWIAVSWHRFILLEEYPQTIPVFYGDHIASYFASSLLIAIVTCAPLVPLFLLAGILQGANAGLWLVLTISLVAVLGLSIMAMRLMTLLPGAALGNPLAIQDMWVTTRGQNSTFLGLVFMLFLIALPFRFVSLALHNGLTLIEALWDIASGYVLLIIGLAVLTVLYGHYIEKRPIGSAAQAAP